MAIAQPGAPLLATVCCPSPAKRPKPQLGRLGDAVKVPKRLPASARKLAALNAPTVRAIVDLLGLPTDHNKKTNVAALVQHAKAHGAVELPDGENAIHPKDNPFLMGHPYPSAEAHGPSVVCTADVRASAHLDIGPVAGSKTLIH